jgi:hypothetical protein
MLAIRRTDADRRALQLACQRTLLIRLASLSMRLNARCRFCWRLLRIAAVPATHAMVGARRKRQYE